MNEYYPIETYFDKRYYGLIGNFDHPGLVDEIGRTIGPDGWIDGGDSLQRAGFYHSAIWYRRKMKTNRQELVKFPYRNKNDYLMNLIQLECPDRRGWYRRHPDPLFWYSKSHVNSRDQDAPNVIAMGLNKMLRLKYYFWQHMKRLLLFTGNTRRNGCTPGNHGKQADPKAKPLKWYHVLILKLRIPLLPVPKGYRNYNWKLPDFTFIEFLGYYIRGFRLKMLYPLLYICDLETLVNTLIKKHTMKEDNDILNHLNASAYTHFVMPTLISKYANSLIDPEDYKRRLRNYFNTKRSPGFLYDVWEPVIDEVMGKKRE